MSYEERVSESVLTPDMLKWSDQKTLTAEQAKRIAREADAEIQRLRAQLAESEAACARYRAALENALAALLQENDDAPCVIAASEAARQALSQPGPSAAIVAVVEAARRWGKAYESIRASTIDAALAKDAGDKFDALMENSADIDESVAAHEGLLDALAKLDGGNA